MLCEVYRNLNRPGMFSIRHKGKVIGYAPTLRLYNVNFHVGLKAQARIQSGEARSVHAWAKGTYDENITLQAIDASFMEVTYRPHQGPDFFIVSTGQKVTTAKEVIFTNNKMFCRGLA